jgi:hypothetical protein
MKSKVIKMVDGVSIAGASEPGIISTHPAPLPTQTATSFHPQRSHDESGAMQIELNQDPDPGGGSIGYIVLEGRLHPDAGWVAVYEKDISDFDGGTGSDLSFIVTGVSMLPEMRIAARVNVTYSVVAGTTAQVWIQE